MCFPIGGHAVFTGLFLRLNFHGVVVTAMFGTHYCQSAIPPVGGFCFLVRVHASIPVALSLPLSLSLSLFPSFLSLVVFPRCIHSVGARYSSATAESMSLAMFVRASDVVSRGGRLQRTVH